jgi:hypothetical protein
MFGVEVQWSVTLNAAGTPLSVTWLSSPGGELAGIERMLGERGRPPPWPPPPSCA